MYTSTKDGNWFLGLLVVISSLFLSVNAFSQTKNQLIFDRTVDYINCRLAQLSLEEQDNGNAPHIAAFAKSFQCDKSLDNPELVRFLEEKNLVLNVRLNNSVNEFKNKFSPTLKKDELISLLEDDLLEVRLEAFAANHVDSYNALRTELSKYINNQFDDFDKKLVEEELPVDETPEIVDSQPATSENANKEASPQKVEATRNRGLGFLVWMLIGGFLGAIIYNMFLRYYRKKPQSTPGQHEVRALRNKNNALQNELDNLRNQNSALQVQIMELQNKVFVLNEKLYPASGTLKTGLEEEE